MRLTNTHLIIGAAIVAPIFLIGLYLLKNKVMVMANNILQFPEHLAANVKGIAAKTKNLGNLRPGSAWDGMTGILSNFIIFQDWSFGVRAMLITLRTYYNKHGLTTLKGMISRYAPSSENNVDAYVNYVSKTTGIGPNEVLTFSEMPAVASAMICHEVALQKHTGDVKNYVTNINNYFQIF